jgi:hypothetical protein
MGDTGVKLATDDDQKEQVLKHEIQRTQLKMDLVKHVSTLSSGAIVILATFIEKNASPTPPPHGPYWLIGAVVFLIASLVSSLIYFWGFGLARQFKELKEPTLLIHRFERYTGIVVASGFCLGIMHLGVFVIINTK